MLKWGFGIEKEFPILIGHYYKSELIEILNYYLDQYDKIFLTNDILAPELSSYLQDLREFFLEDIKKTEHQLHRGKKFYLNLEDIINYSHLMVDTSILVNFKNDFKFHPVLVGDPVGAIETERDFLFFYEKLVYFSTQTIPKSYTVLHLYIMIQYLTYLKKSFNSYFQPLVTHREIVTSDLLYNIDNGFIWRTRMPIDRDSSDKLPLHKLTEGCFQIEHRLKDNNIIKKYSLDDHGLELDSGGYEVRTSQYQNINIPDCVKELESNIAKLRTKLHDKLLTPIDRKNHKKLLFMTEYCSYYLPQLKNISGLLFKIDLQQDYTGEIEFNITLPYLERNFWSFEDGSTSDSSDSSISDDSDGETEKNISSKTLNTVQILEDHYWGEDVTSNIDRYLEIFKQRHFIVMKVLRILSPLFMAVFTGVNYFSFGDEETIPETSFRYRSLGYRLYTDLNIEEIYDLNEDDYENYRNNPCILDILKKRGQSIDDKRGITEFSVNRNEVKYKPYLDKYFGFEWKVLDQFPNHYINNIGLFVILLAQWCINHKLDFSDNLDCTKHGIFLEEIIFQGWNTILSESYFQEICEKLKLTSLDYQTLNKYKIIESCQYQKQLIKKKKIINYLLVNNYTPLSQDQLFQLSHRDLLEILCKNFMKTKPTCYSFLQAIFHHLYNFFMEDIPKNRSIILCFFPDFLTGCYDKYSFIPNINLINYNKMLSDYKKYHRKKFKRILKNIKKDPSNEDYKDLLYSVYK